MKIQKIFETPPLPPFGTATTTTKSANMFFAHSAKTIRDFGSVMNIIFQDVLDAVKRSTRNKK